MIKSFISFVVFSLLFVGKAWWLTWHNLWLHLNYFKAYAGFHFFPVFLFFNYDMFPLLRMDYWQFVFYSVDLMNAEQFTHQFNLCKDIMVSFPRFWKLGNLGNEILEYEICPEEGLEKFPKHLLYNNIESLNINSSKLNRTNQMSTCDNWGAWRLLWPTEIKWWSSDDWRHYASWHWTTFWLPNYILHLLQYDLELAHFVTEGGTSVIRRL